MHEIPPDVIGDDEDMRDKAKKVIFNEEDQLIVMDAVNTKQTIEKKQEVQSKNLVSN